MCISGNLNTFAKPENFEPSGDTNHISIQLLKFKGKGKVHPRTGHEGP
jgi:hypothetical protein